MVTYRARKILMKLSLRGRTVLSQITFTAPSGDSVGPAESPSAKDQPSKANCRESEGRARESECSKV